MQHPIRATVVTLTLSAVFFAGAAPWLGRSSASDAAGAPQSVDRSLGRSITAAFPTAEAGFVAPRPAQAD